MDIKNLLKQKGLRYKDLIEEYNDHFMTLNEEYHAIHGKEKADIYTRIALNRLDVQQINSNYFNLYYKNKLIMLATISTILTLFFSLQFTSDPPSIVPVQYTNSQISSGFGMTTHPIKQTKVLHKGIDIKANTGTKVVATSEGIVTKAEFHKSYGNYIEIKHDEVYTTRYYHLSKLEVSVNDKVDIGQKIGEVGSTGLSSAPHLHYEVIENGTAIDPAPFMKS